MSRALQILVMSLVLFCLPAKATTVVTQNLKGWVLPDGSGYAHEIFKAVNQETSLNVSLSIVPLARAINHFQKHKVDCFLGGDKKIFYDLAKLNVLSSEQFLETNFVISTLKTSPLISSIEQLEGKNIGVERGIDTGILKDDFSQVNINAGMFSNQLEMLKLGRISAILGYYPDQTHIFDELHFDPDFIQYSYSDRLNCVVSEGNKEIIMRFNQGLAKIKAKGIYQKIYNKYFGEIHLLK